MARILQCGRFELSLDRPLIMGVLNVTPDSFSDGGRYTEVDQALAHARQLIAEGVDILDVGGESTRPGSEAVNGKDELARLQPVLEALRDTGIPLSVDTCKPDVMRGVLELDVDMINDIAGFEDQASIQAVADKPCALCVMHMKGEPRTMQHKPHYDDVVAEVREFLRQRTDRLLRAGVAATRIVQDPGFGFGKTAAHNYTLLRRLPELYFDDYPWLVGVSRKTMIGHVTGREPQDRLAGSLAAALAGVDAGAAIVRVHDVAATRDAVAVWQAVKQGVSE
ncbi:dihydropteroate synthase [Pusillimonas sp. CC-YST705]|uniref:Dihydropteroate synthase n=1 Tax=Mesopusillimonas faecipullorum TaxID=2755040 RepID=A0ABS8CEQ3_9BURK|nr:dihydropteroate synthase [Mesopusillimonas faecipullorum]MCB5364483.1 dihydropteroate synthase [Mesopusillimonas faecipullorum]